MEGWSEEELSSNVSLHWLFSINHNKKYKGQGLASKENLILKKE